MLLWAIHAITNIIKYGSTGYKIQTLFFGLQKKTNDIVCFKTLIHRVP